MANVLVEEQSLIDIATAIRAKTNSSTKYTPGEMAGAISTIPTGGALVEADELTKAVIARTITSIDEDTITEVGQYAFAYCTNLTDVSLGAVETIEDYAFMGCSNLKTVRLPNVRDVGDYIFRSITTNNKLELVEFGMWCGSIGSYPFSTSTTYDKVPNLILRYNGVVSFSMKVPSLKDGCYVYVPKAWVETYKSSTQWSGWADYIRAIEDYPDICG